MCNVNGEASWVFSVGGTHVYANYKEGTPISYRGFTPPEDKPRTSLDLPTKATLFNLVLMTCYYSEKSDLGNFDQTSKPPVLRDIHNCVLIAIFSDLLFNLSVFYLFAYLKIIFLEDYFALNI